MKINSHVGQKHLYPSHENYSRKYFTLDNSKSFGYVFLIDMCNWSTFNEGTFKIYSAYLFDIKAFYKGIIENNSIWTRKFEVYSPSWTRVTHFTLALVYTAYLLVTDAWFMIAKCIKRNHEIQHVNIPPTPLFLIR